VSASPSGRIGLLATAVTVQSRAYDDAFAAAPHVTLTSAACPRFVDFVERGVTTGRQLLQLATHYLDPLAACRRGHPGAGLHPLPAAHRDDQPGRR
jgi:glutamate racemase